MKWWTTGRVGSKSVTATLPAFALIVVAFLLLAGATQASRKATTPQVKTAFKRLIADTKKVPNRPSKRFIRERLLRTALRARARSAKQPCVSVALMSNYRQQLKKLKAKPPKTRAHRPGRASIRGRLSSDSLVVTTALKMLPGTKRCGGGVVPPKVKQTTTSVIASDEKHLTLHVAFPQPHFLARSGGGKDYTQMTMDDMGLSGKPGQPGVPATTQTFAIPEGANVKVTVDDTTSYSVDGVSLFPRQPEPLDSGNASPPDPNASTFADKPFAISKGAYRSKAPFPSSPADGADLGMLRDVRLGGVELDGAQYSPALHKLKVLTSVDVTIDFGGANNNGVFGNTRIGDVYNLPFAHDYRETLLNYAAVLGRLSSSKFRFCGEELLIITSPALRPAADTLAASRRAAGYSTKVTETGSGASFAGTTNTEIQSYINGQVTSTCRIRPSYVILFGNTANVPTFLVPCGPGGDPASCNIASDLPYFQIVGGDVFADVAYGRIPAPDLATANTVVNKIVTYETSRPAPIGDDFYKHAHITSFFQGADATDDRGFTKTSEIVHNALVARGKTVDRNYTTDFADPQFYYDGTPIPSYLRAPPTGTFAWDGNTTKFVDAFNGGRFLVFHRDHGNSAGWYNPQLTNGDIASLTNGTKLPVAFGVNCASALFDNPANPSFSERLLQHPNGGAVAVFGDTRNSPSFANNHMSFGFFDALFPNVLPTYGSTTPVVHLGEVLLKGKQYMATQDGLDFQGAGETYQEHYLYHLLGDPTMQMWGALGAPRVFDGLVVSYQQIAQPVGPGDPPPFQIVVQLSQAGVEGTMATLEHSGVVIGRGLVHDGQVAIQTDAQTDSSGLTVSFEQDGFIADREPVPGTPTAMTVNCGGDVYRTATVTGTLSGAPAGAPVRVTATSPGRPTVIVDTQTDKAGNWRADVDTKAGGATSTWTVDARYNGDATHLPSAASCSFNTDPGLG